MQNIDEVLLCKHCKERAFVVIYFLKLFEKIKKNQRTRKTQKYVFLCIWLFSEDFFKKKYFLFIDLIVIIKRD
jgi:hypothetical protein